VVRHGRLIGIQAEFTPQVAEMAIALAESAYPSVRQREATIKAELQREESRFLETLERGEKLLAEILEKAGIPPKRLLAEMPLSSTTPTASPELTQRLQQSRE